MISNQTPPSTSPSTNSKKPNKLDYIFMNLSNQEVMKFPGQVNGKPFKLSYLSECTAWILDISCSITADNCEDSQLYLGPVSGSVQLTDMENCVISVACKQIKCTNCKK